MLTCFEIFWFMFVLSFARQLITCHVFLNLCFLLVARGYWGDPFVTLVAALVTATTGAPMQTFLPGMAANYTTFADAKRRSSGPTTLRTGRDDVAKIHDM